LEKIGKDIGKLKKLKYLDISDNAIETVEDVLEGLMSLAALKEIKIDLATKVTLFVTRSGRKSYFSRLCPNFTF
jgi:hypothetical protein